MRVVCLDSEYDDPATVMTEGEQRTREKVDFINENYSNAAATEAGQHRDWDEE